MMKGLFEGADILMVMVLAVILHAAFWGGLIYFTLWALRYFGVI